jgi:hypothetical protein
MKPARRTDVAAAAVAFFAGALVGALVELLGAVVADRASERQAIAHALDELDELGGPDSRASVIEWGHAQLTDGELVVVAHEVAGDVAAIIATRPSSARAAGEDAPAAFGPAAHARACAERKRQVPGPQDTPEPAAELSEPESAS